MICKGQFNCIPKNKETKNFYYFWGVLQIVMVLLQRIHLTATSPKRKFVLHSGETWNTKTCKH